MDKPLWKFSMLWIYLQYISYVISKTQSVIKGSDVVLRCAFRSTDNVILWLKGTNGLSEGTLIYDHVIPHEFRLRLSITGNHDKGEYHLSISNVRETDEGQYACSLSGNTTQVKLQLSVIETPTSTTIAGKTQENKLVGTEYKNMTISCTAVGGNPAPDMVLKIGNQNYTRNSQRTIQQILKAVDKKYDGATVICLAGSQTISYFPVTDRATIYLRLRPSTPIFSPDPVIIDETHLLSVTSTSTGGRPAPTERKWTIGNTDVTAHSTVISSTHDPGSNTFTVVSTLKYSVDRNDNKRILSCGFKNDATGSFITSTRMIDVKFSPSVSVKNRTYNASDLWRQIKCVCYGNPASYMFSKWLHKSKYGTVIRTLNGNNTLTLPLVSEETRYQDAGKYVCTVSNGIKDSDGNVNQQSFGFVVSRASPVILSGFSQTKPGQVKRDVDIEVTVYSEPRYTLLRWLKGSSTILSSTKYNLSDVPDVITDTFHGTEVQVDGYRLTLTIHNLEDQDFVNYTLRLANGVGQTVEHLVILVPSSPPETPNNFSVTDTTESTATVQWFPAFDGGHKQMFLIEYRVESSNEWQDKLVPGYDQILSDELQVFTLAGLETGTIYEVRILAENEVDRSPPSKIKKVLTRCKSETNTVIGITIGLSIVTVISLIINGILTHRILNSKTVSTRMESNIISTDRKRFTEVYYNVTGDKDDKDGSTEMKVRNYETLGRKDKPNEYEAFDKKSTDESSDMSGLQYETLGTKNKPNVYEKLDTKTQDPGSKLYSNTLI